MATPTDRVYSESHEWHKLEGDTLTLGLTQFAVDQLTDVTYVEMHPPGTSFDAGENVGEVESVKTTSDVYCACAGEIISYSPDDTRHVFSILVAENHVGSDLEKWGTQRHAAVLLWPWICW